MTHEEPRYLTDVLCDVARPDRVVLVDCLTLWVTNLMMAEVDVEAEGSALVDSLAQLPVR